MNEGGILSEMNAVHDIPPANCGRRSCVSSGR